MMKVAMINAEMTRGGASRIAAMLTGGINKYCADTEAKLYHCENRDKSASYIGLKKPASRYVNAFLTRLAGSSNVYDFGVSADLEKLISDTDVIHLHNLHGYYVDYKKLLSRINERPIVWTWHDMWGATGRCGFSFECDRWENGCNQCNNKNYYPAAWIDNAKHEFNLKTELFLKCKNLTIVSPSQWLADIAIKRGFDPKQVVVIPNPVDTSKFSVIDKHAARSKLNLDDKFTVLFVASDCGEERKGYKDFSNLVNGDEWSCIAIGKQPKEMNAGILHVGRVMDQSLLSTYYAASDVMVIPSYADNYPNTVVESLISGTPVIGYDIGGIPSQLDLPGCHVVKAGDIDDLYRQVFSASKKGIKDHELSIEINQQAQQRWGLSQVVKKYRDLYESVQA